MEQKKMMNEKQPIQLAWETAVSPQQATPKP